jgi:tetratricopeptide (TPR) repeat protein
MTKRLHSSDNQFDVSMKLEKEGKLEEAKNNYLNIIENDPAFYNAYNRLLIIYRKQKDYKKELSTVNKAIKAFENQLVMIQKEWTNKNKTVARLSKMLASSLGLIDRKGLPVSEDPLLERWRKRKEVIQKKLK